MHAYFPKISHISVLITFMAKSVSNNDTNEDHDDEMSDQEKDWEELYHITYADCIRVTKYGNKITIKFKAAQEENSVLKSELEQAMKKIHRLESQKKCIAEKVHIFYFCTLFGLIYWVHQSRDLAP